MTGTLSLRRIYEPALPADGRRVLVDRLWPRGVSRAAAQLDEWARDVAPSPDLRRWFGHDPQRFPAFRLSYLAELDCNPAAAAFRARCLAQLQTGSVTLLYAAKDPACCHAAVLREWLLRPQTPAPRV